MNINIKKLNEIKDTLIKIDPLKVYDIECKSLPQLYYMLAKRINEIIEGMDILEDVNMEVYRNIIDKIDDMDSKMYEEIELIIDDMYETGLIDAIVSKVLGVLEIGVKSFGAVGNGEIDDTLAIQQAIDFGYANGLVIVLDEGEYLVSNLQVHNGSVIRGISSNKSILKVKNDTTGNLFQIDGNDIKYVVLKDFTINGNKANVSAEVTGIYTNQDTDTHHVFENLIIHNMSGSGLRLSRGENRVTNIYAHHCDRWGVGHIGSDNIFTNITCAWNYLGGIYEGGASSRWVNCKAFVNGESDNIEVKNHKESPGWQISDSRGAILTGCEAQENYGDGFAISSYDSLTLNGCRADCNGMINKDKTLAEELIKKCGITLYNVKNSMIDIVCDDFRRAYGFTTLNWQYGGVKIAGTNCENVYINAKVVNNIESLMCEWETYVQVLKGNKKNSVIINGVDMADKKIQSRLVLLEDDYDTARMDIGDYYMVDNNCWRIFKETDGSLRIRLYVNEELINDQIQFNTNGLILGAKNTGLGFYGKTPVGKETLKADATDLNTAMALVNQIKSILKNNGMCD